MILCHVKPSWRNTLTHTKTKEEIVWQVTNFVLALFLLFAAEFNDCFSPILWFIAQYSTTACFLICRTLGNTEDFWLNDNREGWRNSPTFDFLQKSPRLNDTGSDSDNESRGQKYDRWEEFLRHLIYERI